MSNFQRRQTRGGNYGNSFVPAQMPHQDVSFSSFYFSFKKMVGKFAMEDSQLQSYGSLFAFSRFSQPHCNFPKPEIFLSFLQFLLIF
jgi:hypothetical protein